MSDLTQVYNEGLGIARRMCYWDNIHPEDREDFVQDALVEMMERARHNGGELSLKEMWRAARCVRNRYWRTYTKGRKVGSLNARIQDTDIELWESLADKDSDLDGWLDAKDRLGQLPPGIIIIARKLMKGDPLTQGQRSYLAHFRQDGRPNPQRRWELKRYHDLLSRGLCVACGNPATEGFVRCPSCLEKFRLYQRQYRREKGKHWQSFLRKHWKEEGPLLALWSPP